MKLNIPAWLIIFAAIGQMLTAIIYPYVRHVVLDWYNDIKKLKPLNKEIAKTYGIYIQALNFSFGFITIVFREELTNQTGLAVAFTGLIAAYWTGRVIIQFTTYPMQEVPPKLFFKAGAVLMNLLIISLAVIFTGLFINNLSGYLNN